MKKEITNKIGWAVMILTASTMGYASDMTLTAHKILFDDYSIPPYLIGRLNSAAAISNNRIATAKRTAEANQIAQNILAQAGY